MCQEVNENMMVEDACEEEDFTIDDWYEHGDIHPLPPPDIDIDAPLVTEVEKTSSSFTDNYAKSIAPVIKIVDMLFARSMWSGSPVARIPQRLDPRSSMSYTSCVQ